MILVKFHAMKAIAMVVVAQNRYWFQRGGYCNPCLALFYVIQIIQVLDDVISDSDFMHYMQKWHNLFGNLS